MPELRELSYPEVTRRLRKLGFRFYRRGKGSHELWVRDTDGRVVPTPLSGQGNPEGNGTGYYPGSWSESRRVYETITWREAWTLRV